MDIKARIDELKKILTEAGNAYYVNDNPIHHIIKIVQFLAQTPVTGTAGAQRICNSGRAAYFLALKLSSTATATATVAPTIGLLPMPIRPIISTCAGTELEPANCASECMRPIVSVMP